METINLANLIYLGSGYMSLPILAASSSPVTAELLLADDHDLLVMTYLVRRVGTLLIAPLQALVRL